MIILISGATHTGKTALAQKLLEITKYPYYSIDHLKMGLIRSGNTDLTPDTNDFELTKYLWPIIREMIKTAIENKQNIIVEGCYIPFDWKKDFEEEYLSQIKYICLILSEHYIHNHFSQIVEHARDIEDRIDDLYCNTDLLIRDNRIYLEMCRKYSLLYILIENDYESELNTQCIFRYSEEKI